MKVKFKTEKQADPDRDHGVHVAYGAARRGLPRLRWYLILLVVSSPLLFFLGKIVYSYVVVSAPGIISLSKIEVNATISGVIDEIVVNTNDDVNPDQHLLTIYKPEIQLEINKLQGEVDDLQSLSVGVKLKPKEIRVQLNKQVMSAKSLVDFRKERLESVDYLFDKGAATSAELATAIAQYDQASSYYSNLQKEIALEGAALDNTRQEYEKEKRVRSLTRELELLEKTEKKLVQRAISEGKILEIFVSQGEVVGVGTKLLSYSNGTAIEITAYLSPKHSEFARIGQVATVCLPNGVEFPAVVRTTPKLTSKLPSNFAGPLGARPSGILIKLEPLVDFSEDYMVQGLPVSIKFPPNWFGSTQQK